MRELWGVGCGLCERDLTRRGAQAGRELRDWTLNRSMLRAPAWVRFPPPPSPPLAGPREAAGTEGTEQHGKECTENLDGTNRISIIMPYIRRQLHRRKRRRSEGRTEGSG